MAYRGLGLGVVLAAFGVLIGQEPNPAEPEVLTRGPIHEAYAAPVNQQPQPGPIANKPPPAPIEELPPDEKPEGDNVQWVPGYWSWDEDRTDFVWVSGFWRQPPPGRQWVPGVWRSAGESWQWTSGYWALAAQTQQEFVPQPPPIPEAGPAVPAPGDNFIYVPGTWVYRETRFAWRPGFWCAHRPDWVYIPACYTWTPYGYVFVDGYWDYPLARRGVLFAPVYFGVAYRPAVVYRPSFVVYNDAIFGALFVRPGCSTYYFGDYFDARYRGLGYRSWIDVRIGVGAYDPLWSYYRCLHATTPGWTVGISTLYAGRFRGDIPRPPRTFVQQNTVVNNIVTNNTVVNNTTVVNNVKNVTMVAPVSKVDKDVVKLTKVNADERLAAERTAREVRQAAAQRTQLEQQAFAAAGQPADKAGQPKGAGRPVRVDLPKSPIVNVKPAVQPPPPPAADLTPPAGSKDGPKNALTPQPKDGPKGGPPALPKGQPKVTTPPALPKDQPKVTTPPALPKDQPKVTTPPALPKDQPKVTPPVLPKDQPKLNTPPALPKDQPKVTPPAQPKYRPQEPPPLPKVTPAPPPLPREQPKTVTPPPLPKGPSKPPESPRPPANAGPGPTPQPMPSTPPAPRVAPQPPPPAPRVVPQAPPPAPRVAPQPPPPAPRIVPQAPPPQMPQRPPVQGNPAPGPRPMVPQPQQPPPQQRPAPAPRGKPQNPGEPKKPGAPSNES